MRVSNRIIPHSDPCISSWISARLQSLNLCVCSLRASWTSRRVSLYRKASALRFKGRSAKTSLDYLEFDLLMCHYTRYTDRYAWTMRKTIWENIDCRFTYPPFWFCRMASAFAWRGPRCSSNRGRKTWGGRGMHSRMRIVIIYMCVYIYIYIYIYIERERDTYIYIYIYTYIYIYIYISQHNASRTRPGTTTRNARLGVGMGVEIDLNMKADAFRQNQKGGLVNLQLTFSGCSLNPVTLTVTQRWVWA